MDYRHVMIGGLVALTLGLAGCGDHKGGAAAAAVPPPAAPTPANVAGVWSDPVPQNGAQALLTACTGDLLPVEGAAWNQVFEVCPSGGLSVAQHGPAAVAVPTTATCANGAVDLVGAGIALDGSSFQGLFHEVEPNTPTPGAQTVITDFFTGSVADAAISLSASRVEVRGGRNGGCAITPALALTSTITR